MAMYIKAPGGKLCQGYHNSSIRCEVSRVRCEKEKLFQMRKELFHGEAFRIIDPPKDGRNGQAPSCLFSRWAGAAFHWDRGNCRRIARSRAGQNRFPVPV